MLAVLGAASDFAAVVEADFAADDFLVLAFLAVAVESCFLPCWAAWAWSRGTATSIRAAAAAATVRRFMQTSSERVGGGTQSPWPDITDPRITRAVTLPERAQ